MILAYKFTETMPVYFIYVNTQSRVIQSFYKYAKSREFLTLKNSKILACTEYSDELILRLQTSELVRVVTGDW